MLLLHTPRVRFKFLALLRNDLSWSVKQNMEGWVLWRHNRMWSFSGLGMPQTVPFRVQLPTYEGIIAVE